MRKYFTSRRLTTAALFTAFTGLACPAVADEGNASGITAEATIDYVSQYFFRGVEQIDSDQGAVIQPGISFTLPVEENIGLTVGTWGSFHTDTDGPAGPGAASNPSSWYEQDIYASLDFVLGDFEASVGATYYTFPSSAVNGNITELNFIVSYDDAQLMTDLGLEGFAMNPYVELAVEVQNNLLPDENIYLELGGEFELGLEEIADLPITITVPVALGLSLDDYYTTTNGGGNETFGYLSVGLFGSVPLKDLIGYDEWMGAWDLTAGVTVYFLNSDVSMTDNTSDSSDNYQFVATIGVSREW